MQNQKMTKNLAFHSDSLTQQNLQKFFQQIKGISDYESAFVKKRKKLYFYCPTRIKPEGFFFILDIFEVTPYITKHTLDRMVPDTPEKSGTDFFSVLLHSPFTLHCKVI